VVYLWFLAFLGAFGRRTRRPAPLLRCCLIVPAHNEESGLHETISSLLELKDAREATIYIVADNCTDSTAEVARRFPVEVLERRDPRRRGKGYALEWALQRIDLDPFEAVVIVDADTRVDQNLLEAVSLSLGAGFEAVQLNYQFQAAEPSALAYLQQMASATENRLFYHGRAVAGLPILLRGNGMAIRTEVLREHPWDSHSITEDVDYSVDILAAGARVDFTLESTVYSAATASYGQSSGQKERWAAGTFALVRDKVKRLIAAGLRQGRFELLELAFSLFLLSRPLLIYSTLLAIFLGVVAGGEARPTMVGWGAVLIALLVAYLLAGWFFVPDRRGAFKAILQIPIYGVWFLIVQIRALIGHRKSDWVRTERKE
jgi:cellulose synthase/poly-beta-1,6-N-acetylglucosamine synthase-like glycosyltransferase